jgi:DNA helicase II / ATP-dependent DNA helicase PcrA
MQTKEAQAPSAVREAAQQLLSAYRASVPAWNGESVPLDALAGWLGLDVATFNPDDYPPGTFGYLEPEERLIWLRRDLSPSLRRFTLAHELGHAILHRHFAPPVQPVQPERYEQPLPSAYTAPTAMDNGRALDYSNQEDGGATREDPCHDSDVRETLAGPVVQHAAEEMLGPGISGVDYDPRSQRELDANLFAAELLMPLERVRALYLSGEMPPAKLADLFGVSQAAMLNHLAEIIMDAGERKEHKGPPPSPALSSPPGNANDASNPCCIEGRAAGDCPLYV